MSRRGQIAVWFFIALVAAPVCWATYGIGYEIAQARQRPVVIVVQVSPWPAPAGTPGAPR